MLRKFLFLGLCLLSFSASICAENTVQKNTVQKNTVQKNTWQKNVPPALREWIPWVLRNDTGPECLPVARDGASPICVWYPEATLELSEGRLVFTLDVYVEQRKAWVNLPYAEGVWPQELSLVRKRGDSEELLDSPAVLNRAEMPQVLLDTGRYVLRGILRKTSETAFVRFPASLGLLHSPDGRGVDAQGQYWFTSQTPQAEASPIAKEQDVLAMEIFRKIEDALPAELETLVRLRVGGRKREVRLPGLLLGTSLYAMESALPLRLDDEHNLIVRVQAGHWDIRLRSLLPSPFSKLRLNEGPDPLPSKELWSFQAHPELRSVQLAGSQALDPSKTNIPQEWQQLPAYTMQANMELQVTSEKRADVGLQKDSFQLSRDIVLHDNAQYFSLYDSIQGMVYADSRLNFSSQLEPGQVQIAGLAQSITRLDAEGPAGVEIRSGQLNLQAESRMSHKNLELPVTGWDKEFLKPQLRLFLPPGWRLLGVQGGESVQGSWISKWDLLEIFLVLTAGIFAVKLFGPLWGTLAALGFVLLEHDFSLAFMALLLFVLGALEGLVQAGRLAGYLSVLRRLLAVGLLLSFLAFSFERVRLAIFPQLEPGAASPVPRAVMHYGDTYHDTVTPAQVAAPKSESAEARQLDGMVTRGTSKFASEFESHISESDGRAASAYIEDPKARTQTGFGRIERRGMPSLLSWSGPVQADQSIRPYFLSPLGNLILAFMQVLLGFLIILLALGERQILQRLPAFRGPAFHGPSSSILLLGAIFFFQNTPAWADPKQSEFPPQVLLEELAQFAREKTTEKPACLPFCAAIEKASLVLRDKELVLTFSMHAQADSAFPVLSNSTNIIFEEALVQGKIPAILTKEGSALLLRVPPGRSTWTLRAKISGSSAGLSFQHVPYFVEIDAQGWQVSGLDGNRAKDLRFEQALALRQRPSEEMEGSSREEKSAADKAEMDLSQFLTPRVHLERHLQFGNEWEVRNVLRVARSSSSVQVFPLPLLQEEKVTSGDFDVDKGTLQVKLLAGQSSVAWNSSLAPRKELRLQASKQQHIAEIWTLSAANLWNVTAEGAPQVLSAEGSIRRWQPRPGEYLQLQVTRPKAIDGPTRTIQSAKVVYTLGPKLAEAELDFEVQSSLGQAQSIRIEGDPLIQEMQLNATAYTTYSFEKGFLHFDLPPGLQKVKVRWRENIRGYLPFRPQALDLQVPTANIHVEVVNPVNRWVLWTAGPQRGPAVLFWGILPILLLVAWALGRSGFMPFGFVSGLLFLIGLSFQPLSMAVCIFGFLLVLGLRGKRDISQFSATWAVLMQIFLALWSLIAVSQLFAAIRGGLLGSPNMRIAGNGSSWHFLRWAQDVSEGLFPLIGVYSLPILAYRVCMLLWSVWLAFAIIRWGAWIWRQYSRGGWWPASKTT